jgi:hypothetical protein
MWNDNEKCVQGVGRDEKYLLEGEGDCQRFLCLGLSGKKMGATLMENLAVFA